MSIVSGSESKSVQDSFSLLNFPKDILGSIIEKCNEYTWASLRGTCRTCRTLTSEYMNEETAARRVFACPDSYPSLREGLRRSPHVATNAFSRQPSLLYDRATPLSISANFQMVKIALVTAKLMGEGKLYRRICSDYQDPSVRRLTGEVEMALKKLDQDVGGDLLPSTSEAWRIPSFLFRYFLPKEDAFLIREARCVGYGGDPVIANKDVMKHIVGYCPEVMQYASEALRDCSDFALELVRVRPNALFYMSDRVRSDRNLVLRMIRDPAGRGGDVFASVSPSLQNDKKTALAAIRYQKDYEESIKTGYTTFSVIQFASSRLKSNREVVWEAVRKYGSALCDAIGFKDDEEIVMTAFRTRNSELERIHNKMDRKASAGSFKECKKSSEALLNHSYVSETLRNDEDVVFLALSNTTENFQYAGLGLKQNKEFCLRVLKYYKEAFIHFDDLMKRDPDIQRALKEVDCCVIS